MTTDWVGGRVFRPAVDDVRAGFQGPLGRQTHYIQKIRYPRVGGYQRYGSRMRKGADIRFGKAVSKISLRQQTLWTEDGDRFEWKRLINTLPLPVFTSVCEEATPKVIEASRQLSCSSVHLVNIEAQHPTLRKENWIYVYDEDKYSSRINFTEKLSPENAPTGLSGIQVEVYHSRHKPLEEPIELIQSTVEKELVEMGLLAASGQNILHGHSCRWGNVIFTHDTKTALDGIWSWLEEFGLERETDDLSPTTDWNSFPTAGSGPLAMVGRYGQWKYFWTDDCTLRGAQIAGSQAWV